MPEISRFFGIVINHGLGGALCRLCPNRLGLRSTVRGLKPSADCARDTAGGQGGGWAEVGADHATVEG